MLPPTFFHRHCRLRRHAFTLGELLVACTQVRPQISRHADGANALFADFHVE